MSVQTMLQKYRGINPNDLDFLNPDYSCVICKNLKTCDKQASQGKTIGRNSAIAVGNQKPTIGCACGECEPMTEEEFAKTYDFGS